LKRLFYFSNKKFSEQGNNQFFTASSAVNRHYEDCGLNVVILFLSKTSMRTESFYGSIQISNVFLSKYFVNLEMDDLFLPDSLNGFQKLLHFLFLGLNLA